jgi:hypothetical protein
MAADSTKAQPPPPPFLPPRSALILMIALVLGQAVGVLTYMADHRIAAAVMVGLLTTGGAIPSLDRLLGR